MAKKKTTTTSPQPSSFISSTPTDTSKPFSTTIALGQQILEELKLDHETDILGQWLAHYLAEKMERAVSTRDRVIKEADQRECVDLILRLWEHRQAWPLSAPLKDVADRLDELLKPKPRFFHTSTQVSDPFLDLLHGLEDLHSKETQVCLVAWAANLDLRKDREYLHKQSELLDSDEHRTMQYLVEIQDLMAGSKAHLAGEPCPNFSTLSKNDRSKIVSSRLREIAKSRTKLLKP